MEFEVVIVPGEAETLRREFAAELRQGLAERLPAGAIGGSALGREIRRDHDVDAEPPGDGDKPIEIADRHVEIEMAGLRG